MGQVVLGLRSLLFKLAVFFVMATLLAWALGGTLWPRAEAVDLAAVRLGGQQWFWRCLAGGRTEQMRWQLMRRGGEGDAVPAETQMWDEVAGPLVVEGWLYYACRADDGGTGGWQIRRRSHDGTFETYEVLDRLSVEQQLERVRSGLAIQDLTMIRRQRGLVVNPPELPADELTSAAP